SYVHLYSIIDQTIRQWIEPFSVRLDQNAVFLEPFDFFLLNLDLYGSPICPFGLYSGLLGAYRRNISVI
ncbi:hypothetical protein, partial [Hungatella sp.]|uniref:hypothetical protein n=1 Tax=Hungatella sp. TaxID=2613924 RepID=UPI003996BBB5